MRHYLLTRSSFAPTVSIEENRRRIELLAHVTVPAIKAQESKDFAWIVLINPRDPLLEERRAAIMSAGLKYTVIKSSEDMIARGGPDKPWGPWKKHIKWDQVTLTTRMDDDDALAPFAMRVVRERAEAWDPARPTVWSLPAGYRVMGMFAERVLYTVPMFCTYQAPVHDHRTINTVGHLSAAMLAPLQPATKKPAWLWVRHDLTRSHQNMRRGLSMAGNDMELVTDAMRAEFPGVDWDLITSLPQKGAPLPDKTWSIDPPGTLFDPRSARIVDSR